MSMASRSTRRFPRFASVALVAALTIGVLGASAPASARTTASQEIRSLVEHVAGLVARLGADERRLLSGVTAEIARLRTDAARAARTRDERLAARVRAAINAISMRLVALPLVVRQDEFGVRTEPRLGDPDCPNQSSSDACSGEWLSTRSPNFHNIRKIAYLGPGFEYPQGVRVNASFVAERDDTVVAAIFSAEAYIEDDNPGANRRMFVRALIDGAPADPGDVVFATTDHQGTRQFLFTARVAAGIHTVEIQWRVDSQATAYLRNANLLVRSDRDLPSARGTLTAQTPRSGRNLDKQSAAWEDVPGTSLWFWSPPQGTATVTFTAEARVTGGKAIAVRALIDNAVVAPSDVVFARGADWQSRGFTFGQIGLASGWHSARVQWLVEAGPGGGTGSLGDRSIAVAAYPSPTGAPTHPFVAAPSGPNYLQPADGLQQLVGMSTPVFIPADGNGEVAVIFSAEVVSPVVATVILAVDGAFQLESLTDLTDGTIAGQAKSYVLEAKGLSPGIHQLDVWLGGAAGATQVGDRTIAVMSEVGYVPDLAEAPTLTGGRVLEDHIGGIEPLIGPHKVLTILFDPYDCSEVAGECYDEETFTPADMTDALYGAGESANGWFLNNSGGRFNIENAGVLGWYQADHPASYYWDATWDSCDDNASGFSSGHAARVSEAVQAAKDDIDFASFDVNQDGRLTQHELAILVVVPAEHGDGSSLAKLVAAQCPSDMPLQLDGVELPGHISGWFTSLDDTQELYQFTTANHELLHQFSALDDIYVSADHATFPRRLTIMSQARKTTSHLDPVHKLALGWVTPRLMDANVTLPLTMVELGQRVLVLPRYDGPANGEEYYVVENRRENAGPDRYDDAILDSGIAVWHAISDPVEAAKHPIGVTQTFWDTVAASVDAADAGNGSMGRWGVRLLRPWVALTMAGVAVFPDKEDTLWDSSKYNLNSGPCPAVFLGEQFAANNVLAWADCTPSGYGVRFLSGPAVTMTVRVTVP